MSLPQYEQILFQKSPLRLVIGQLRFTIMPRFEQRGFIADFQEAIRAEYPKASRENVVAYQLSSPGINSAASDTAWRFSSKDLLWAVVINETALTLETRNYRSIQDFTERFQHLLEVGQETLDIADCLRLGLRYMVELRHPAATETLKDWQELLNPRLLGFDATDVLAGQINQTFQEIQMRRPDGTFAIRHGLLKGRAVPPLPKEEAMDGAFYLLDLDYYDTDEYDLDIPDILKKLRNYNEVMSGFFRWTLSEKLHQYLEPGDVRNT
jgi:uncharacterized protein (TIGR04255 family)